MPFHLLPFVFVTFGQQSFHWWKRGIGAVYVAHKKLEDGGG